MPELWLVGGPNGSGKSTWIESATQTGVITNSTVVSPDTIMQDVAKNGIISPFEAGRRAIEWRNDLLASMENYVIDTTFSGRKELNELKKAASVGYDLKIVFIGLDDHELARGRVLSRVAMGGHDVPIEDIRRRFAKSIRNMWLAIVKHPEVIVFDNSRSDEPYRVILEKSPDQAIFIHKDIPDWFLQSIPRTEDPFYPADRQPIEEISALMDNIKDP